MFRADIARVLITSHVTFRAAWVGSGGRRAGSATSSRPTPRLAGAVLVLACLAAAAPRPAAAQEVQVPLDVDGRVLQIDATAARRLELFVDRYPDLREVRLFVQLPDSTYVLEITRVVSGQTVRVRESLTAAAVRELRERVTARLAAAPVETDQDGRVRLVAASAAVGLGYYGWAVPEILDVDETRIAVAAYMLTSAATIIAPWVATRNAPISDAMAELAFTGASRGIAHGVLLEWLVTGEDDDPEYDPYRPRLAAGMAVSLAEGIAGYWWARNEAMHRGQTYSIANGADFGMLGGLGVAGLVVDENEDEGRLIPGLVLAGGAIGIPAAWYLARVRGYSHGDAHLMRTAGALGIATGLMVVDWTDADEARPFAGGALLGGLGGLFLADRLTQGIDLAIGTARLVQFGTVAGAALGVGTAYLVSSDGNDDVTPYLTLGTLGAAAGFGIAYAVLAPDPTFAPAGSGFRLELLPTFVPAPERRRADTGSVATPGLALRGEYRWR